MNCVELIYEHARATPQRPALIDAARDQTLTYGMLRECVERMAATLEQPGLFQGRSAVPRIGLLCPDGVEYVLLALALLRGGACVVPIAGELSGHERCRLVDATALDAIVLGPDARWADPPGRSQAVALDAGLDIGACTVQRDVRDPGARPAFDEAQLAAMEPAFVRFSSGTTGACKGIVLSHRRLRERVEAANAALRIGPADRVIWMLPMAHHFAVSMMLYLINGAAAVVVKEHLAARVLDAVERYGGTVLYAAPFHHALLAEDASARPWPTLRLAISTAAALPGRTAEAFDARFGVPLAQALGVIEVGLPLINLARAREKPGALGRPLPAFEIALRSEAGEPVAAGEVGELHLRGPGMLDAYLVPWRPGAAALDDGWFRTGDLARVDEEGDVHLVGRRTAVINVAGLKCFPEEVEAVLAEHPQVGEARVSGQAHPRMGAVPVAEVVPADVADPPTSGALASHCRRLAAYKRPIRFELVECLPRTASGKIRR